MIDLAPNNPYGLTLASPVLTAAGCFGYGVEYARMVDVERIGAIVTRSTTAHRRRVARPPRLVETPAGLLAVGPWPNPGVDRAIERYARTWATWRTPVLLSIEGTSPAEYAEIGAALEGVEGIAGLELNLTEHANQVATIVRAARAATQLPLLAKLPVRGNELAELARTAAEAGADSIVVAGAARGLAADPHSGERLSGWLCGPAQRPLALRLVAEVVGSVAVPVV
ncbi:MAG TPA: dihydroorotate dehydrogenase, partial [Roseiflexaceae bacterium]|nr:dihydroorotate dehydrogenase [Roseiflexaceae bacterium]